MVLLQLLLPLPLFTSPSPRDLLQRGLSGQPEPLMRSKHEKDSPLSTSHHPKDQEVSLDVKNIWFYLLKCLQTNWFNVHQTHIYVVSKCCKQVLICLVVSCGRPFVKYIIFFLSPQLRELRPSWDLSIHFLPPGFFVLKNLNGSRETLKSAPNWCHSFSGHLDNWFNVCIMEHVDENRQFHRLTVNLTVRQWHCLDENHIMRCG